MKVFFATIALFVAINTLEAQPFKLDTLLYNGNSLNRINFVILGDGYLNTQLPKFLEDAEGVIENLFSNTPFKEYRNYFNVFVISVPSNVEGAASDPASPIDNYFGSTFNYAGIERLLVPLRQDRAYEILATTFPAYDQVMMIVNSTTYGGSGGSVSTSSVHQQASEIAIHELGHSFAGLSDEYWAGEQYASESPNMTSQASPSIIRWKNWLNDFGIGIIAHDGNPKWYKPHNNCKMQVLETSFCSVCQERFIRRIQELVSPLDAYSWKVDPEAISFGLDLVHPVPNTLNIKWYLNGSEFDRDNDTTTVDKLDLNSGANIVEATIYDSTLLDRQNKVYITSVKWTIETTITATVQETLEKRNKDVITGIESESHRIRLSVFPNPSSDNLTIEYNLTNPAPVQLFISNSEGKQLVSVADGIRGQGNFRHVIDISEFSSGLYFLNFKSGSIHQSLRIIKME